MSDITLYFAPASRAFTPRWLLEELALPYRIERIDLAAGGQKAGAFLAINPMGKVPALTDGTVRVAENPAICLYLADRYGLGMLAPPLDDDRRGDYLRWMVFATAVFEPALYLPDEGSAADASGRGWGSRATVIHALDDRLSRSDWLVGETFTAADVMLGSLLAIALFNQRILTPPASLTAYSDRLMARPAFNTAAEATWG